MPEGTDISPTKESKPGGCQSGACGTGGCNKLNVHDWLTDMTLPPGQAPFDVIEVRFKGSRKEFFRNKENVPLAAGDIVAVESNPGHDVGVVSMVGELVRFQLKKKHIADTSDQIRTLYRKAKPNEVEKWNQVKALEAPTLHRARKTIDLLKLSMKLSDVEYQGDGKKATFYYTADERVDFRELIKRLADEFRVRIEMRQIGMRQEAGRLGGIGSCGRELCCSTWLTDFKTVSTSTARYQNLALNPAKLAGQCGKLKCCLNYELDTYLDALKDFPKTDMALFTEKGRATHRKTDIFKRTMWYAYDGGDNRDAAALAEGGEAGNWIPLSVDRVKEIIDSNRRNEKPADLKSYEDEVLTEALPDYENVVGQDRIDRMDRLRKHKKKKKRKGGPGGQGGQQAQGGTPRPQGQGQPRQEGQQRQQGQRQQPRQGQGQRPQQGQNQNQGQRPQQAQGGQQGQQGQGQRQQGQGQGQGRSRRRGGRNRSGRPQQPGTQNPDNG
jgi:cell fate regulator YaaT (PSP1 superfamily)